MITPGAGPALHAGAGPSFSGGEMKRPFVNDRNASLEAFVDWWNKERDDYKAEEYESDKVFYDPAPYVAPEALILRDAEDLITGERNGDYGPANEDFSVIAEFWNSYLQALGMRVFITAKDVALMMTLLKIRREATHPKRDNLVDGCGYLALAQKCEEEDHEAE